MKKLFFLILFCFFAYPTYAADFFYWATRVDRDGKPAGIFTTTPFPVDENSSSYSITNDEGTTTYTINPSYIYFVDGNTSGCSNGSTNYNPETRTCGSGSYTVYTTPTNALSAITAGNKTILVRDNGSTYTLSSTLEFAGKYGNSNTARYMMIGYKQERPTFTGCVSIVNSSGVTNAYLTLQRMKFQTCSNDLPVGGGYANQTAYVNLIDLYIYGYTNNLTYEDKGSGLHWYPNGDGGIHWQDADYGWAYHNTVERVLDHGIKYSDGSLGGVIEWNYVKEAGYYTGITDQPYGTACGIDVVDTYGDVIIRYNIVDYTLFDGIQLRNINSGSIHHNELANFMGVANQTDHRSTSNHDGGITHNSGTVTGLNIYSNVVRDSITTGSEHSSVGIGLFAAVSGGGTVKVYNNLIYNVKNPIYNLGYAGDGVQNHLYYNNSLYTKSGGTAMFSDAGSVNPGEGDVVHFKNNIAYAPSGTGANFDSDVVHTYNLYYVPSGSLGVSLSTGEKQATTQDFWVQVPAGTYDVNDAALTSSYSARDAGTNLSSFIGSISFNGVTRDTFDIGANEYSQNTNMITGGTISGGRIN
jgi:hypothetical protein